MKHVSMKRLCLLVLAFSAVAVLPAFADEWSKTYTVSGKPDLKIVFVSGYAEEAFANNRPEGYRFLAKPFSLKTLVATVKETMAS